MPASSKWRVVLGLGAVAVLVVLAGCSYATHELQFRVDSVESSTGGVDFEYEVRQPGDDDFTFHDVVVLGYGPNGTVVCEGHVGTVGSDQVHHGRLSCSGFPQVFALDAAESAADSDDRGDVRLPLYRYAGYDGSDGHEWTFVRRRETVERDGDVQFDPLPPDETLFERVKCEQRVADENVSALGATPWVDADVGEPDKMRSYTVRLTNASAEERRNGSVRLSGPPAVIESLVREFQRRNESGSWAEAEVSRSEWFGVLRALGGGSPTNATDFPVESHGRYRTDTRGERCWNGGGEFGGSLTARAEYVVTVDGTSYYLLVEYTEEWE